MYKGGRLTICDRLTQIKESIYYIQQWSKEINCADDFLASMDKVMVFNACVMRLQVIGEQVGKLLFLQPSPLSEYKEIPWLAIYDMRNLISHEYSNVDEQIVFTTIKNAEIQNEICVKSYLSASYKHCADMVFQYRSAWISDDKSHEKAIPSV